MTARLKRSASLRIVIIYLIISCCWIFFSDTFISKLFQDIPTLTIINTLKGWLFVVLTSILIYLLIEQEIKKKNELIKLINESKEWYNVLVSNIPDIHVYLFDKNLKMILAQGSGGNHRSISLMDIQNKSIDEVSMSNQSKSFFKSLYTQILNGNNIDIEYQQSNDWYEIKGAPIRDESGEIYAGLTVFINVNKKVQYEKELIKARLKAEESDKLKSVFLANMSHEIRTPLNGILGFSDLLINKDIEPDKREEYVKIIKSSSNQLVRIINDILDISKIETGQFHVNVSAISLNTLLDEAFLYLLTMINDNDKDIEGREVKSFEKDDLIYTDKVRLQQVLLNLISNAVKFTDKGYIEIGYKQKENTILFFVKDTGIGIPSNKHRLIFERFRQVEESFTRTYGGTGLGLPISKGIIELMGGKIWLESKAEEGSTFYFTIPYKKA
jgi:signal transduction histidine kinase